MRGIKELLQLVLDKVNELDTKEMGICFFVFDLEVWDIITKEECKAITDHLYSKENNPHKEGNTLPEEFLGYGTVNSLCFFKIGDWDIRRRYLSYLISKL